MKKSLELVVSRYREDLQWILDPTFINYKIIVYDKCKEKPLDPRVIRRIDEKIDLPNFGRECGTYLHHIIERYDSLPDVTVFLHGSAFDEHKRNKTRFVVRTAEITTDSVMSGSRFNNVGTDLHDFYLDEWISTNKSNRETQRDARLLPSPERPFGRWYRNRFGDHVSTVACYYATFAVSRDHIRSRPKDFYRYLYEPAMRTTDQSECLHYMERAWDAVFRVPERCKFYAQ